MNSNGKRSYNRSYSADKRLPRHRPDTIRWLATAQDELRCNEIVVRAMVCTESTLIVDFLI